MILTPRHIFMLTEQAQQIATQGDGEIRIVFHAGRVAFIQPSPYLKIPINQYQECASCSGATPCERCPLIASSTR
jgi:hypothetical protein